MVFGLKNIRNYRWDSFAGAKNYCGIRPLKGQAYNI
jgi:hypothetical protein